MNRLAPAELFVGSFLILNLLGTLGLRWLPGLYTAEPLNWHDAAFTATSAVCVTGLTVVDTATRFTWAGQAFLLLLIQLGGLGMLTLSSIIITALGGRPSLRAESVTVGETRNIPHIAPRRLILDILRFTLAFELAGAVVLFALWAPELGWREALWPAVFHSVSAFCNAGFSTYSDSLIGFQRSPASLVVIALLISAGGLGFVVMEELWQKFRRRKPGGPRRLSVHTRLVLLVSAVFLAAGWALFLAFESGDTLRHLPWGHKVVNALFMSATARTAGFNNIDYAQASDSANFLTILLMLVGGSPGSTAGGMKTTTFALIGLLAWSRLRSRDTVTFAGRSIPDDSIQRAVGLSVITGGIVVAGIFLLTSIGDLIDAKSNFLAQSFEVVSAFCTVGLSMGLTSELSVPSRWVLVVLMFVGRTGPLSIAAALVVRRKTARFRLAYEDVNVG